MNNRSITDPQKIQEIQDDLNDLIERHTTDPMTLLHVASVLYSSSLKCYCAVLGPEGVIQFVKESLDDMQSKPRIH